MTFLATDVTLVINKERSKNDYYKTNQGCQAQTFGWSEDRLGISSLLIVICTGDPTPNVPFEPQMKERQKRYEVKIGGAGQEKKCEGMLNAKVSKYSSEIVCRAPY